MPLRPAMQNTLAISLTEVMSLPMKEPPAEPWLPLVRRLRSRDEAAAREAVERLYDLVARVVGAHRPQREEHADLMQEVFLRVFSRIDQFREQSPFPHWVSRIALRVCLDRLRHHQRRPTVLWSELSEGEQLLMERLGQAEPDDPDLSAAAPMVERLLSALPPKDRLLISWLELEQRSVAEVSAMTGWSKTLVRVRAYRARKRLQKQFSDIESLQPPP